MNNIHNYIKPQIQVSAISIYIAHTLKWFFMHNTWFGGWCLAGLIIAAFSSILSLTSPVYQIEMLCWFVYRTQLSCLSSLVSKSIVWKADGCGFESHLRQPIFFGKITVLGELCCVTLLFCYVVVVALPFSASLEVIVYTYLNTKCFKGATADPRLAHN